MSIRRTALDALTRPRLWDVARKVGIVFYSNASRHEMVNGVCRSHRVPFKELLSHFLRDELKLACQRLELGDNGRERSELIKRIIALDRQLSQKRVKSSNANSAKVRSIRTSRSRGTATFLNGVQEMEEPKIIPATSGMPDRDVMEPAGERDGVVLTWGGKRTEVDRIVLPFQRIEVVNESRATREAERGTFFRDLKEDPNADSSEWRNKLIWVTNYLTHLSLVQF